MTLGGFVIVVRNNSFIDSSIRQSLPSNCFKGLSFSDWNYDRKDLKNSCDLLKKSTSCANGIESNI